MDKNHNVKVGLIGIGLDTYWKQFDGLFSKLLKFQEFISKKLSSFDVIVVDKGIIDTPQKSQFVANNLKEENVDVIFVFVSTYALSSTLLPVSQICKVPIILLNIQPTPSIDYDYVNGLEDRGKMTGEWLAYCQSCPIPEFSSVFNRSKVLYEIITGYLTEDYVWHEVEAWIKAVKVVVGMRCNRLGILGHYYGGMLDVYTDLTMQSIVFGTHIEQLEMCELKYYYDSVTKDELLNKRKEFNEKFIVVPECDEYELDRAARTSVALDKLVTEHNLGSLAYYYEGVNGGDYENLITSVIAGNTLLTGDGIPVAGECEVKNVQAMKIMSLLGVGGSFSEPYAMDFNDDIILWGHDGPAHFDIAEGKVKLVPLPVYHGKPGKGLSIQMIVKYGDVTFLSVCEGENGIFLLVAEGESISGPVLNIGNTNSRYKFSCGARDFINEWSKAGPSHHCAIGIGHVAHILQKVAFVLNIPFVKIC